MSRTAMLGVVFGGLLSTAASHGAAQELDSLVQLLNDPNWRVRSAAVYQLNEVSVLQLPSNYGPTAIALLEQEAVSPDEAAFGPGEGYGEYLLALARGVLRLSDPASLRGMSLLGIQMGRKYQDFVASFGASSIPHLDEAWANDSLTRSTVVRTWALMLREHRQQLSSADAARILRRVIDAANFGEQTAFILAARRIPLPTALPAVEFYATDGRNDVVRRGAARAAEILDPIRASLSPSALHGEIREWLDAVCLDRTEERQELCVSLEHLLDAGPTDGIALDRFAQQVEAAVEEGIITEIDGSGLAPNARYLIDGQGLSVPRATGPLAETHIMSGSKKASPRTEPTLRVDAGRSE